MATGRSQGIKKTQAILLFPSATEALRLPDNTEVQNKSLRIYAGIRSHIISIVSCIEISQVSVANNNAANAY